MKMKMCDSVGGGKKEKIFRSLLIYNGGRLTDKKAGRCQLSMSHDDEHVFVRAKSQQQKVFCVLQFVVNPQPAGFGFLRWTLDLCTVHLFALDLWTLDVVLLFSFVLGAFYIYTLV
jgi:hypothetical protein